MRHRVVRDLYSCYSLVDHFSCILGRLWLFSTPQVFFLFFSSSLTCLSSLAGILYPGPCYFLFVVWHLWFLVKSKVSSFNLSNCSFSFLLPTAFALALRVACSCSLDLVGLYSSRYLATSRLLSSCTFRSTIVCDVLWVLFLYGPLLRRFSYNFLKVLQYVICFLMLFSFFFFVYNFSNRRPLLCTSVVQSEEGVAWCYGAQPSNFSLLSKIISSAYPCVCTCTLDQLCEKFIYSYKLYIPVTLLTLLHAVFIMTVTFLFLIATSNYTTVNLLISHNLPSWLYWGIIGVDLVGFTYAYESAFA